MVSKRYSSHGRTMLWKECMSRDSIVVMGGRSGSKSLVEYFSMSATRKEFK